MKALILGIVLIFITACGVKSDPVPPATPAEIGKGGPMYKGSGSETKKENEE